MADDEKPVWTEVAFRQEANDLRQYGSSVEVIVSAAGKSLQCLALIDTGSHSSAISARLAKALGIDPIRRTEIREAGREVIPTVVFRVGIAFPTLHVENWEVICLKLTGPHQVIIGRDMLAGGRLSVEFHTGKTWLWIRSAS